MPYIKILKQQMEECNQIEKALMHNINNDQNGSRKNLLTIQRLHNQIHIDTLHKLINSFDQKIICSCQAG